MRKTYVIATESSTGQIRPLKLAPMALSVAETYAKKLREISPRSVVYVLNVESE